ncbi:ECF-type sigma factor [Novosphingobium fuchskuhlense]|nr:ECF-type sigma factor [Novosphingobium fuchskuhlense]
MGDGNSGHEEAEPTGAGPTGAGPMAAGLAAAGPTSSGARDALLASVYDELRQAAARLLRRDAPYLTLQPTELVNEAALRLMKLERMSFADRQHFFATGARVLRQAMIDAIRARRARKRQAPDVAITAHGEAAIDIEALDAALVRLEAASPELARLVELRFFAGLSVPEIAALWQESESTVKRRWKAARLWLAAELKD